MNLEPGIIYFYFLDATKFKYSKFLILIHKQICFYCGHDASGDMFGSYAQIMICYLFNIVLLQGGLGISNLGYTYSHSSVRSIQMQNRKVIKINILMNNNHDIIHYS